LTDDERKTDDDGKRSAPINEMVDRTLLDLSSPEASRFAAMIGRSSGESSLLFAEILSYPSLRTLIEPHVRPGEVVLLVDFATQGRLEEGAITISSDLEISPAGRRGRLGLAHSSITGSASEVETSRRFLLRSMSTPAPSLRDRRHRQGGSVEGAHIDIPLPEGVTTLFAEISNDDNPIHTDPAAAALAGFSAPSVHGTYLLARAVSAVADALEWSMAEIEAISCRFGMPVSEGESLYVADVEREGTDEVRFSVRTRSGTALRRVALGRKPGLRA
jgi:acyl dehydratase